MIDATRGSIRVRSWPKPRPGPRHPTNEFWTMWLKAATYLYRYQPASVQWELQQATKGTVYMPRDLFISAARGRAFLLQDEFGRKYYPMPFVQDVSDSLDAIGQFPGMMLYRGADLWVPIQPGNAGQSLVYVDDDNPPVWSNPPADRYQQIRIFSAMSPNNVFLVNNTAYQFHAPLAFTFDVDELPFTSFRILVSGQSSQLGQTITLQLAVAGALNSPISAAGNDLIITSTPTLHNSGWVTVANPPTGFNELVLAIKGSNGTVDLGASFIDLHLRRD